MKYLARWLLITGLQNSSAGVSTSATNFVMAAVHRCEQQTHRCCALLIETDGGTATLVTPMGSEALLASFIIFSLMTHLLVCSSNSLYKKYIEQLYLMEWLERVALANHTPT
ncbi:hypothetical protein EVAR_87511_1 [Eumeta japonica]|uniref:Secreted protein n=1 Tax=Eumeta variegata TaxID=151549 RepID=A0A4C1Z9H2_EUMVA|nr:hypothetical protein EVAR_87511_1 [Eumeta japonica]